MSKQWQPYARHILDTVARLRRIEARGDLMQEKSCRAATKENSL